jgi:hypothetical protein
MKHWRLIAAGLLAVAVLTGSLVAALGSSSRPARRDPRAAPQSAAQLRTLEREARRRELAFLSSRRAQRAVEKERLNAQERRRRARHRARAVRSRGRERAGEASAGKEAAEPRPRPPAQTRSARARKGAAQAREERQLIRRNLRERNKAEREERSEEAGLARGEGER